MSGDQRTCVCAEPAESISRIEGDENGEPAGQHRVASGQNGSSEPVSKRHQPSRGKRRKRAPLADLLGRDVVLDGSLFSTPGTTYTARIMKKVRMAASSFALQIGYILSCCVSILRNCLHAYHHDMQDPTHRGAVIIRFEEDNSRIWLPAEEVRRFIVEDECGEQVDDARADTLAAQVLVSLSGRSSADDYSQVCLQELAPQRAVSWSRLHIDIDDRNGHADAGGARPA